MQVTNLRRRYISVFVTWAVGLSVYLSLPIIAGAFELGDRRGPRVYPISLHAELYLIGWEMTSHEEDGKPRMPFDAKPRPLFYGMDQE